MSRRAQAERERQARIILGTAETGDLREVAAASPCIRTTPWRCTCAPMNMLYEAIRSAAR